MSTPILTGNSPQTVHTVPAGPIAQSAPAARSKPRASASLQIVYILLGCLLAAGATWTVNQLYHFGGAFGRLDRINPLFVEQIQPIPPGAVRFFHWESRDFGQAATLLINNQGVVLQDVEGHAPNKIQQQFLQPLPASDYRVFAEKLVGRGFITVVQQPSPANHYTAAIRIEDPYTENSDYRLNLYFQTVGAQ